MERPILREKDILASLEEAGEVHFTRKTRESRDARRTLPGGRSPSGKYHATLLPSSTKTRKRTGSDDDERPLKRQHFLESESESDDSSHSSGGGGGEGGGMMEIE